MGKQVDMINTPVSDEQLAQAIADSWQHLFGTLPSKEQVYMIMSQISLENGINRESMHNYNVGNIIVGDSDYDYFIVKEKQYSYRGNQKLKVVQHFRAYESLQEGIADYLKLLSGTSRYASAWQHIKHPDIQAYSKALHEGGYYEAKEPDYTSGLMKYFNKFEKGDSYSAISSSNREKVVPMVQRENASSNKLDDFLNQFLEKMQIAAQTNYSLKKLYGKFLPTHNILIQIAADDYASAVEFSHVLCAALDEDLLASSYPYTDGQFVEIECSISGPEKECFESVNQMTQAVVETFKDATVKIGGIVIKNNVIMNKKSSYQPISPKTADTVHRTFLLKFI